jgi:hypothetical protein
VTYWRKTQERRAFLATLRDTVGTIDSDSELARWLEWADAYVEGSDPLERFRSRAQNVKLYFSGYNHQIRKIKTDGFEDPDVSDHDRNKTESGIVLRDRRPGVDWLTELIELELPEDVVLPYEVTEPGYVPRLFCIPARVLNVHFSKPTHEP